MALHQSCSSTLGVTNSNAKFPLMRKYHKQSWTMIIQLYSYCEIGTPSHELMNDKWQIYFYRDVDV